jgi:hypothetical protein
MVKAVHQEVGICRTNSYSAKIESLNYRVVFRGYKRLLRPALTGKHHPCIWPIAPITREWSHMVGMERLYPFLSSAYKPSLIPLNALIEISLQALNITRITCAGYRKRLCDLVVFGGLFAFDSAYDLSTASLEISWYRYLRVSSDHDTIRSQNPERYRHPLLLGETHRIPRMLEQLRNSDIHLWDRRPAR